MFEIIVNNNIEANLKRLLSGTQLEVKNSSSITRDEIQEYLDQKHIPMDSLQDIYKTFWKSDDSVSMKQLLSPLDFKFKEKRKPGANYTKEFKEQLEKLRLKQEEIEYQKLVKGDDNKTNNLFNVKEGDELELTPAQINKQIKEQVTTIFNILLSVVSVVFAIWYWTGTSMRIETQYRILLCLFFGILVLVAEVVVYNSYLTKIDDAKQRERNKKERKKVVKKL